MRISDWSSDVCSSDLHGLTGDDEFDVLPRRQLVSGLVDHEDSEPRPGAPARPRLAGTIVFFRGQYGYRTRGLGHRSEERRVGHECVRTCRSRWPPYHYNRKRKHILTTKCASTGNHLIL